MARELRYQRSTSDPKTAGLHDELQRASSKLANLAVAGPQETTADEYRRQLAALDQTREMLESQLALRSWAYGTTADDGPVDASRVAQALPAGSALVEYVKFLDLDLAMAPGKSPAPASYRYAAFVLPAGATPRPQLIDLGPAQAIDDAIHAFRIEIAGAPRLIVEVGEAAAERQQRETGFALFELVFAPLHSPLRDVDTLYLAPDGELNLLPFGVLPDQRGTYLIETRSLYYLSTGRDLLRHPRHTSPSRTALVIAAPDYDRPGRAAGDESSQNTQLAMRQQRTASGDLRRGWSPLPGTRREADRIQETLAGMTVSVLTGEEASEGAVKNVQSPSILHLATHGFFLVEQPTAAAPATRGFSIADHTRSLRPRIENPMLRSGLVLAGANRLDGTADEGGTDDGILTAMEAGQLSLEGTSLVVLSACETGIGTASRGQGVFGLRRAFETAGAESVVMSLWSVPDEETADLMANFYENLQEGVTRSLQQASLAQLATRRAANGAAHPFFWGAFVCVGAN